MARFILQRLRQGILSLLGLVLLVFVLARLTGSPAHLYLPEDASPQMVAAFNAENGFDKPLYIQLVHFLAGVFRLDFGESLLYGDPAVTVVLQRFPATLQLASVTMLIAVTLAIVVGAASAARRGSYGDAATRLGSMAALSVPDFWIALMGVAVFAVYWNLLPTSGMGGWQFWVLPLLTLALRPFGILTQVVRASMLDALDSDYVRVAKSKGVGPGAVIYKHALRNAAIPILTVAGILAAQVVNGALVVETVFGWPGIGNLMVTAIKGRDFAVIQAVVLITGAAIIVLNFLIDIAYSWLNPQIGLGE
ncbi:ABC transporter permease [Micromonospora globispora]|uniref:ABC transporter permease n=1 Tax=Micromonospora globispora TaxID=1450148 RepID=UPI000D6F872A|nr:ABC transporter permease [Micromonospora globispora]PWU55510.1 ABC transporter permease [Micromonospora globispora]RQW91882.1 ABC transporter permease [Micromonospora globispora]